MKFLPGEGRGRGVVRLHYKPDLLDISTLSTRNFTEIISKKNFNLYYT